MLIEYYFFPEKYFDMNKKHARDALDLYKKFLIRMDRVADFLKVAEVRFLYYTFSRFLKLNRCDIKDRTSCESQAKILL